MPLLHHTIVRALSPSLSFVSLSASMSWHNILDFYRKLLFTKSLLNVNFISFVLLVLVIGLMFSESRVYCCLPFSLKLKLSIKSNDKYRDFFKCFNALIRFSFCFSCIEMIEMDVIFLIVCKINAYMSAN